MNPIDSEQGNERIVKFIIGSILLVDAYVLFIVGQALLGYVHRIAVAM